MRFEFFVGWRYLSKKKKNLFLSAVTLIAVLGVAVSVMTVVVVLAVMNGFGRELERKITANIAPVIVESYSEFTDYKAASSIAAGVEGVTGVSPYIMRQGLIRHFGDSGGVMVMGIDPEAYDRASGLSGNIASGVLDLGARVIEFGGQEDKFYGILIGKTLAGRIGAGTGSIVHLVGAGAADEHGNLPTNALEYIVTGIFDTGMHEYDSSLVYICIESAGELFDAGGAVDGLEVRVRDIYRADEISKKIAEALGPSFAASSWMQRHRNLFSALALEKKTMFIVLSLIVLVAAFNIMSTLVMLVMEKTKDIGILKSIGAGRLSIMMIFMLAGIFIGLAGVLLGSGAGYLLCAALERYPIIKIPGDFYLLDTLPVSMNLADFLLIGLFAFLVSVAAAIYPAVRASLLSPVEALRYE